MRSSNNATSTSDGVNAASTPSCSGSMRPSSTYKLCSIRPMFGLIKVNFMLAPRQVQQTQAADHHRDDDPASDKSRGAKSDSTRRKVRAGKGRDSSRRNRTPG